MQTYNNLLCIYSSNKIQFCYDGNKLICKEEFDLEIYVDQLCVNHVHGLIVNQFYYLSGEERCGIHNNMKRNIEVGFHPSAFRHQNS